MVVVEKLMAVNAISASMGAYEHCDFAAALC